MLEELHFDTNGVWPDGYYFEHFGNGDWKLPLLKVLVYRFWDTTFQGNYFTNLKIAFILYLFLFIVTAAMMGYIVKVCVNIHELHLKNDDSIKPRERVETIERLKRFYMSIRFRNLTKLSICELDLFDGCYLPMV